MSGKKQDKNHVTTDSVVETILQQENYSEPDIVKSTKSQRTLPSAMLAPDQPVAPPRRKKSRNLVSILYYI